MDYFLQKVGGKSTRQAVTLRRCTPAEAPAVFALQNEVRAAMPHPEQFVPDTLENITGYLRTGICIGAWQQRRLGAYLILRLCGQSDENYAAFLGVPQSQWQHWANADSAVVHPDWRGNGLQRAMLEAALPLLPRRSLIWALPSARITATACATHRPAASSSAAAGRCTAATTAICWKSSCNSMQFWCTTFSKCVILYGMNNSEGNR